MKGMMALLITFILLIVGCSKDESKTFTYDFNIGDSKYEFNVVITNYSDRVFTKVSLGIDGFRSVLSKTDRRILEGLEIYFYDSNGIDLDFSELFGGDEFQIVKTQRKITIVEGQESTKLDDDEKYVFEKLESIVIEYGVPKTNNFRAQLQTSGLFDNDDEITAFLKRQNLLPSSHKRTEQIKRNFW
jgi:uncharacterized protein YcfL|tara:strand:+ start:164 stop:724 length:561 start_codon:yes stop_codon:yes gene_type:complete